MYKVKDIIAMANKLAPQNLAYAWDNTGIQIGELEQEVTGLLLSLDINEAVVDEAIAKNCQMIITHHPLIFRPLKKIKKEDQQGRMIYKIIANKINVFTMHTNLDKAEGGINDYLANIFGLTAVRDLRAEDDLMTEPGPGRIGSLDTEISLGGFLEMVKEKLKIEQLRYVGDLNTGVKTIAICSGSGADFISLAAAEGADLLLTGDIKYHQAQEAEVLGLGLVDAGHYQTEVIVKSLLYDYFNQNLPGLKLYKSELNTEPWNYLT
ncbi:MAG TPA: Nif3-like dinuclear metal center hexameric protein [Halanaerobiaceae bacterium]|jgi:dinuclear metal center YbgI/SA1388 family protein|nr:Nif3-like dinuclear metal center hexameric protein [Bacillota bacterium]HHU91978.1 Nif3-like dinuclear metal center hexameric protein [Halanaerobiaceae bacterium]HOA40844.1 Nif3-like dinuclear metal center hexameric protein [Halanaerobiales bacterium]HPZ62953.1 Nif3-like dinuclear metal center hexameric protein [Halanaerobiales bacterium]HQD04142.1 Nif3-like dinuclear metal center hexameric protein [Halanaerobiales bacterium]